MLTRSRAIVQLRTTYRIDDIFGLLYQLLCMTIDGWVQCSTRFYTNAGSSVWSSTLIDDKVSHCTKQVKSSRLAGRVRVRTAARIQQWPHFWPLAYCYCCFWCSTTLQDAPITATLRWWSLILVSSQWRQSSMRSHSHGTNRLSSWTGCQTQTRLTGSWTCLQWVSPHWRQGPFRASSLCPTSMAVR